MKIKSTFLILLIFLCLFIVKIQAQPETFFPYPDSLNLSYFGISTAVNETYAVVGSLEVDFDEDEEPHPVYVFKKNTEGQWGVHGAISPLDFTPYEESFGWDVAISDDNVIVVANDSHQNEGIDDLWYNSGAIYVFEYENEAWTQTAKLPHPNPNLDENNNFGHKVDIDGDYIIASDVFYRDENADRIGSAYVYHRVNDEWILEAELLSPNPVDWGVFGQDVAINDNYIMVTEAFGGGDITSRGKVHVFKRTGDSWPLEVTFEVEQEASDRYYGASVSMEDSVAVVGASPIEAGMPGFAEVLNLTADGWEQGQRLWSESGNNEDYFGFDVAVKNSKILVSASNGNGNVPGSGKAYLFTKQEDEWSLAEEIIPSNGQEEAAFSFSVSLSDNDAVIGSHRWLDSIPYFNTVKEWEIGGVYFYDLSDYNVAVENPDYFSNQFQLSPNPASELLNLTVNDHVRPEGIIKIYDALGRTFLTQKIPKGQFGKTLDVSRLLPGLYYCEIGINGKRNIKPFVKL